MATLSQFYIGIPIATILHWDSFDGSVFDDNN